MNIVNNCNCAFAVFVLPVGGFNVVVVVFNVVWTGGGDVNHRNTYFSVVGSGTVVVVVVVADVD